MVGTLLQGDQQPLCSSALTTSMRNSAHVARLYPTDAQSAQLEAQGHTTRAVWNLLHEWYTWGGHGRGSSRRPCSAEIDRQLRAARIDPLPGWEWLANLPAQATQQVLKHYLLAWDRFFEGSARRPRFKRRAYGLAVDVPQASQLRTRLTQPLARRGDDSVGRTRAVLLEPVITRQPCGLSRPHHRGPTDQRSTGVAYLLPHPAAGQGGPASTWTTDRNRPRSGPRLGPVGRPQLRHAFAVEPRREEPAPEAATTARAPAGSPHSS